MEGSKITPSSQTPISVWWGLIVSSKSDTMPENVGATTISKKYYCCECQWFKSQSHRILLWLTLTEVGVGVRYRRRSVMGGALVMVMKTVVVVAVMMKMGLMLIAAAVVAVLLVMVLMVDGGNVAGSSGISEVKLSVTPQ